jgi:hypothetical protein
MLWVQFTTSAIIILSMLNFYRQDSRQQTAITLEPDHQITLHYPEQEKIGILLAGSVVTPFVALLRVKLSDHYLTSTIPIFYDALPIDHFRKLRVKLNFMDSF